MRYFSRLIPYYVHRNHLIKYYNLQWRRMHKCFRRFMQEESRRHWLKFRRYYESFIKLLMFSSYKKQLPMPAWVE